MLNFCPLTFADPKAIELLLIVGEAAHPDEFISVLVNNAGIRRDNVMFMMSEETGTVFWIRI